MRVQFSKVVPSPDQPDQPDPESTRRSDVLVDVCHRSSNGCLPTLVRVRVYSAAWGRLFLSQAMVVCVWYMFMCEVSEVL